MSRAVGAEAGGNKSNSNEIKEQYVGSTPKFQYFQGPGADRRRCCNFRKKITSDTDDPLFAKKMEH